MDRKGTGSAVVSVAVSAVVSGAATTSPGAAPSPAGCEAIRPPQAALIRVSPRARHHPGLRRSLALDPRPNASDGAALTVAPFSCANLNTDFIFACQLKMSIIIRVRGEVFLTGGHPVGVPIPRTRKESPCTSAAT